jgi:hypothetical protein
VSPCARDGRWGLDRSGTSLLKIVVAVGRGCGRQRNIDPVLSLLLRIHPMIPSVPCFPAGHHSGAPRDRGKNAAEREAWLKTTSHFMHKASPAAHTPAAWADLPLLQGNIAALNCLTRFLVATRYSSNPIACLPLLSLGRHAWGSSEGT